MNDPNGSKMPEPPLLSRHVEFVSSAEALATVKPWWKPKDVNLTISRFGESFTTSASDLVRGSAEAVRGEGVRWLRNTTWFVDVSHGGTANMWQNICHFSNAVLPFFEAVCAGAYVRPLAHVLLWQARASRLPLVAARLRTHTAAFLLLDV